MAAVARDPVALGEAVAALRRYSLVKTVGDGLAVHRLLQSVVREDLDPAGQQAWATVAVRLLYTALPGKAEDVRAWPAYQRLLPHALAATEHAQQLGVALEMVGWLLNRAGNYTWGRGLYPQAKAYLEQALTVHQQALGAADPAVATDRRDLAGALWSLGDYATARTQLEQAIAVHERALGPDHPEVATIRNNLASSFRTRGTWPAPAPSSNRP